MQSSMTESQFFTICRFQNYSLLAVNELGVVRLGELANSFTISGYSTPGGR